MMVHAGTNSTTNSLFPAAERVPACFYRDYARIEPCNHPNGTNYSDNGSSLNKGCNHCLAKEPYSFQSEGNWNDANHWLGNFRPDDGNKTGNDVAVRAAATIPASCIANVGNIDLQDGGSLTIADGGQLLHTNAVAGTIQKNIAGYGQTTNPSGWYLLGAPILIDSAQAVNSGMVDFANGHTDFTTHGIDLYDFDQSQDLEWENMRIGNRFHLMGLNVNHAYLYARANDATLNFNTTDDKLFAPTSNDSLITVLRVTNGAELAGYNLLSNPFTCNAYLASGRDFWRMNATNDAIVLASAENGGNAIKPCEGFFVVVGENDLEAYLSNPITGVTISAKIAMTTTEPEPTGGAKGLLDIKVSHNSQIVDVARVRFGDGDRTNKLVLDENATRLSITQDGKDYSVVFAGTDVARNVSTTNEMPLNFKAKADGTYTITVNPEGVQMAYLHLIDNMTGADVDLLAHAVPELVEGHAGDGASTSSATSYTFTAKTTDYESRFKLVFSANETDGPSTGSGTFAFISDGNIIVNGTGTLQVIDLLGRQLSSQEIHSAFRIHHSAFPAGVYVLRLINGDDVKTQKIVVR